MTVNPYFASSQKPRGTWLDLILCFQLRELKPARSLKRRKRNALTKIMTHL